MTNKCGISSRAEVTSTGVKTKVGQSYSHRKMERGQKGGNQEVKSREGPRH